MACKKAYKQCSQKECEEKDDELKQLLSQHETRYAQLVGREDLYTEIIAE